MDRVEAGYSCVYHFTQAAWLACELTCSPVFASCLALEVMGLQVKVQLSDLAASRLHIELSSQPRFSILIDKETSLIVAFLDHWYYEFLLLLVVAFYVFS